MTFDGKGHSFTFPHGKPLPVSTANQGDHQSPATVSMTWSLIESP